jgi:predicted house-cleaning noncanonical NTP pyrophosphatase (MazG superfamily)
MAYGYIDVCCSLDKTEERDVSVDNKKKLSDKLVRDKIPEILREKGIKFNYATAEGKHYLTRLLKKKISEEVNEYLESGEIEELVDIVEVVYKILRYNGISVEDFEVMRKYKNIKKGSFNDNIVLVSLEDKKEP